MPHHEHIPEDRPHVPEDDFRFERFEDGRSRFVSGVFDELEDAERAARSLEERGYPRDEITVFLSKETRDKYLQARQMYEDHAGHTYVSKRKVELEESNRMLEGTGAGAVVGGAVGAVAAALAAVGTTLTVPPLGLVVAGPVAAALAGAGAGGAAGGLVGALVGAGMSEYRAKRIDERLRKGGVVLGIRAHDDVEADELEEDLTRHGGEVVRENDPGA